MDLKVVAAQQRIDSLETKAKSDAVKLDIELQSQLARFLCVLASGLIELAVIQTLAAYSKRLSHPNVSRYVSASVGRLRNAKFEDVLIILGDLALSGGTISRQRRPPKSKMPLTVS